MHGTAESKPTLKNKETKNMQSSLEKFFIRKGLFESSSWRICFWDGETRDTLKALKGLEFTNQRDAQAECDLQNLAEDLRVYFKNLPEFAVHVGNPSKLWTDKDAKNANGRSIIICAKNPQGKPLPLFACGAGEQAFARGIEFLEMVEKSRKTGFIPAPPVGEYQPDRYEVNMYSNIASVEGQTNDAMGLLIDARAELDIAIQKAGYNENAAALELFQKPLEYAIRGLKQIIDGNDHIEHKNFEAFVGTYGFSRITREMFEDDRPDKEKENSFIDGYENICNEEPEAPITDEEQDFVNRMRRQFPDDDRDDTRARSSDDDERDADDERIAEENYIGEILDELPHVTPFDGLDTEEIGATDIEEI